MNSYGSKIASSESSGPRVSSNTSTPSKKSSKVTTQSHHSTNAGLNNQYSNASAHSNINSANSSQYSPSAGRRVWVKRPNGTPTTLKVHINDIVDDLKLMVMNKFPNSLARVFDPADLALHLELGSKQPNSTLMGKRVLNLSMSPDNLKNSPTSMNTSHSKNTTNTVTLEPDQNVFSILDLYFPNGMGMSDSFVIVAPQVSGTEFTTVIPQVSLELMGGNSINAYGIHSNNNSGGNSARGSFSTTNYYRNNSNTQLSAMYNTAMSNSNNNPQNQQIQVQQPSPPIISTHSHLQEKVSTPVLSSSGHYHAPKPQYLYQATSFSTPGLPKDRSVSPATINSPVHASHRRSHSNPPQSPVSASNGTNSQAVLLLPKNFSLAGGGSSSSNNLKKRYSVDEGMLSRKGNSLKAIQTNNLTNIGVGITSPDNGLSSDAFSLRDKVGNNLKLKQEPIEELVEPRSNGKHNVHNSDLPQREAFSMSPSPPGEVQRLNSPTRDTPNSSTQSETNNEVLKPKDAKDHEKNTSTKSKAKNLKSSKSTTDKVLPSISVLVVEDNAINQAILGAFLRKHKIHYQIAKNGQEAIDKWRKGGFHLVLMDIQLPVKSGIEATKEIRHLEKINRIGVFAENELVTDFENPDQLKEAEKLDLGIFRSPVIIVALTASSNSSVDKKNALMAGCNDYLTKPVNLVWLQNKITEWGCMQALIDFDGWNSRVLTKSDSDKENNRPVKKNPVKKEKKLEKIMLTTKAKPVLLK